MSGDALEGKGPQRRPQQRLDRRLEEVAQAVGGGYCRLQMPLRLALGVRETVAGHRLGALGEGGTSPPSNASLPVSRSYHTTVSRGLGRWPLEDSRHAPTPNTGARFIGRGSPLIPQNRRNACHDPHRGAAGVEGGRCGHTPTDGHHRRR